MMRRDLNIASLFSNLYLRMNRSAYFWVYPRQVFSVTPLEGGPVLIDHQIPCFYLIERVHLVTISKVHESVCPVDNRYKQGISTTVI